MATSDLLQSTYVDVVRSIKDFQGDDEPQLVAWVTRIMENNLRDRARFYGRQRRNPEVDSEEAPEPAGHDATPSVEAMQVENIAAVGRALAELPEEQRQIMQLRLIEGREYEEIAAMLGRSVGSLRMLLSRARASLTVRLDRLPVGFVGCWLPSRIRARLSGCCGRLGCHSTCRSWRRRGRRRMGGVAGSGRELARVMVVQRRLRGRCGGAVCLVGGFPGGMPWWLAGKLVGWRGERGVRC